MRAWIQRNAASMYFGCRRFVPSSLPEPAGDAQQQHAELGDVFGQQFGRKRIRLEPRLEFRVVDDMPGDRASAARCRGKHPCRRLRSRPAAPASRFGKEDRVLIFVQPVRDKALRERFDIGRADERMLACERNLFRALQQIVRESDHRLGEELLEFLPLLRILRPAVPRKIDLQIAQENLRRDVVVFFEGLRPSAR